MYEANAYNFFYKSQESTQLWLQYESMMSNLSHLLCEELRLILQPTETSQLKWVKLIIMHGKWDHLLPVTLMSTYTFIHWVKAWLYMLFVPTLLF